MLTVPERRGFSLVEIVIAMVIVLVVTGALHRLLLTTQRLTQKQLEQVALQSSVRAGSLAVVNELRELSTRAGGTPDENDIVRISPTGVVYRAMRGTGFICQAPSAGAIRIDRARFSGHRDPQAGRDTAYVFVPGAPGNAPPDSWFALPITGVGNAACPGGVGLGITLTIPSAGAETGVEVGSPVRIVEVMELRLYQSEGKSWLGARSVSAGEPIQPVVGPLDDARGFRLEYLSGAGIPTTDLGSIKSVKVTLRGRMDGRLEEELVTQVTLRNAFRQ
jgi:prepilin-type N-terminal cleavage/methylation domain-containing protein